MSVAMSGASWPDHQGEPDAPLWPAFPAAPPAWQRPPQYTPGQHAPGSYVSAQAPAG
jgi:hypothetical protein